MVGRTLGHYRIIEKVGVGGMGEIYRAHDEHLVRDVAIKVISAVRLETSQPAGGSVSKPSPSRS
jgi:serine/threonine protein kinase